jgi:hypothetical protein
MKTAAPHVVLRPNPCLSSRTHHAYNLPMKYSSLLLLPLLLVACSKFEEEPVVNYSNVWLDRLFVNLIPFDNNGAEWDPNSWGDGSTNPDVYVIIRNRQGMIYEVTSRQWDIDQTNLPLSYNWLNLQPTPQYRDELVFEFWDADDSEGQDQLMGQATIFPFQLNIQDDQADFNASGDGFVVTGSLYFTE